ncbi:hypothetical protein B484DRAFT_402786 [Ochromonadaceae sp. CCMP2298]|nr:hypothetical protein B484DRAFT_402786 [Ochromonadaceae sp. CCMP2298]
MMRNLSILLACMLLLLLDTAVAFQLGTSGRTYSSRRCTLVAQARNDFGEGRRDDPKRRDGAGDSRNTDRKTSNPGEKAWQSGYILNKRNDNSGRRTRNDPWWMREEERNNPRIFPPYQPWWLEARPVESSWKVADLREVAGKRGLDSTGLKADLIERINLSVASFSLSDDAFTVPIFVPVPDSELTRCYPEVYEGGLEAVQVLIDKNDGID